MLGFCSTGGQAVGGFVYAPVVLWFNRARYFFYLEF